MKKMKSFSISSPQIEIVETNATLETNNCTLETQLEAFVGEDFVLLSCVCKSLMF